MPLPFLIVSDEVQAERLAICTDCDIVASVEGELVCPSLGQRCSNKVENAHEACPLSLWSSVEE